MLTLLGSLLGFGSSFLPKVMDFFQDKADKKHELEVMTKQAEINLDRTAIDAEIITYYLLVQNGIAPGDALVSIWDEQIMAMWASILAFWFGGRQFRK